MDRCCARYVNFRIFVNKLYYTVRECVGFVKSLFSATFSRDCSKNISVVRQFFTDHAKFYKTITLTGLISSSFDNVRFKGAERAIGRGTFCSNCPK